MESARAPFAEIEWSTRPAERMRPGEDDALVDPHRPVFLTTKFARPSVRPEHVARAELLELLREGIGRRLTLVAGPPGFGKTTLLAEWAAAEQPARAVAWLSLDEDDNDPARFFAYVIEALRSVRPDVGRRALAAQATPGARVVEVVLPLLLNDLAALDAEIALVLDDYHVIATAEIHQALTFLVERLPESLRLVLATRQDPPLPLGRLRARGQLSELRAGELRFSDEETTTFLNEGLALGLSAQDVERLQARTEGWPAALYLAALSLRGRDDAGAWIAAFAGDDRHLVDYLSSEVLSRQPPEARSFLLRTSVLTRLCGPLCDQVTERDDSAAMLDELARSNLFLSPLDRKREWYAYHQLFAELLRWELRRAQPELVSVLHRRASVWCREAGLVLDAARHARAAGDVEAAVELVGSSWPVFLAQGQLETVSSWLDLLPEDALAENWLLCLACMTIASHTRRLDDAERWLETAERAPRVVRGGQRAEGRLAAARSYLRLRRGDIAGAVAAARQSLAVASSAEHAARLAAQMVLGGALWWSGELAEGRAALEQAAGTAERAGLLPAKVEALGYCAAIDLEEGATAAAAEHVREALALTRAAALDEHPFTAMARTAAGRLHAGRGELAEAQHELERAMELADRDDNWLLMVFGALALADLRHRQHEPVAARRLLARARGVIEALPAPGPGLRRVEHAEKGLGLRAARSPDVAAHYWELSQRELDVLRLLASRLSQREIGAELYISFNTVKSHMRSIFRKLGVASRAEAVERAREHGLL